MKRLATPAWRAISSTDTTSSPRSMNRRAAVSSRRAWRRAASSRVGRPPGPRLNSTISSDGPDIRCNALVDGGASCAIMQRNRCVAKRPVVRRLWVAGLAIAAVVAFGAGLVWYQHRPPAPTRWQGYAEADFVKVAPTQQGLLTAVAVARGDQVAAGALLFRQDDTADRAARDQAARQLGQANEQLANLQAAAKPTEIDQADANLADARVTLGRAKTDLDRAEALSKVGGMSAETLDQRRADFHSATAKVAALEAVLAQAHAPMGRSREIEGQR